MGGHHEDIKIPHPSAYSNYRQYPQLVAHEKRLGRLGLSDPWIRNIAFNYSDPNSAAVKGGFNHFKVLIRSGFKPGLVAAVTLIAIEEGYSYLKHGHTSWDSHH
uniref:NADH dehydrogenase [ubiquinone] 1 beta subcomplex subunit 3 n=1 Tax=Strongyloides papillosus TaxID=174720 RepID=A0A0N5BMR0_STREA